MTPQECLDVYGYHYMVQVDSGTEGLLVRQCLRCHLEEFEELDIGFQTRELIDEDTHGRGTH